MSVPAVTDADFAERVLGAPVPVLVDVWASWCAPCVALEPVVERLAESYRETVRVVALDADSNLETVTRYDVRALPTLLLFDRGALVERVSGAQSYGSYAAMLDRRLATRAQGGAVAAAPSAPATPRAWFDEPVLQEAQQLVSSPHPTVVFKHSPTCSISVAVKREYDAFVAAHPHVPTRMVLVQRERSLSDALADVLRIRHESPQAIVVQDGAVIWHASHRRVTAERIAQALRTTGPDAPA
jgi:thioredoxin